MIDLLRNMTNSVIAANNGCHTAVLLFAWGGGIILIIKYLTIIFKRLKTMLEAASLPSLFLCLHVARARLCVRDFCLTNKPVCHEI